MRNLILGGVLGFALALALAVVVSFIVLTSAAPTASRRPLLATAYSQLIADVDEGKVERVVFYGSRIFGWFKDGRVFESYAPQAHLPTLTDRLLAKGVTVESRPSAAEEVPSLVSALINWAPLLVTYALLFLFLWLGVTRPVLAVARQIEASLKIIQERSSEPPSPRPEQ